MERTAFGPDAWRPLAEALEAFWQGNREATLTVYTDDGDADPMSVALFFRGREELREVDRQALTLSRGRVLDVGAGVGSLALILQEEGYAVTAVEAIPEAVGIMIERGVRDARAGRVEDLAPSETFDTILVLMNGSALAGTLDGLPRLLGVLEGLLAPGGSILMDSTDLLPSRASAGPGQAPGEYPGELQYQIEFAGVRGAPFPQLFVDPATLKETARAEDLECEVIWRGEGGEFLARLYRAAATDRRKA